MKIPDFVFGVSVLMGFGQILATADDKAQQKSPMAYTVSAFDGMLYRSEIEFHSVRKTGGTDGIGSKTIDLGIGLIPATELGVAAIAILVPHWKDEWVLHCAGRRRIGGIEGGYLYEVVFVKQSVSTPDSPSSRLNIWVLFDGTVIPTKISKNGS